ncbi:MAG: methyltransferase domain-containing protein [Bacteroidota bacterium]|jgi:SAM-dependent methyltransferase|nr:MAG: hypothetical protein DIU61_11735 [Bacteroidota bacterium]
MDNKKTKYTKPIDLRKFNRDNQWRFKIAGLQKEIAGKLVNATIELKSCPICGSPDSKHFVTIYEYPYHECAVCGHLYSKRPPTEDSVALLYNEDKEGNVLSGQAEIYIQKELYDKRVNDIAAPKVAFVAESLKPGGKWVDIGAGVGDLVLAARKNGWDAVGFESDAHEVAFATQMGSNVVNKFLTPEDMVLLKDADVVSTINVLEHILNPKALVNSIAANLPVGAHFVFEVPRFPSLSALVNRCFPDLAARNIYAPDHLHLFSDRSAEIMLDEAGLEPVSCWFFGQDVYELITNCLAQGNFENHDLIDKVLSLTNQLQAIVDQNQLSDTMLMLTKKK